jgi:hypothetical protein
MGLDEQIDQQRIDLRAVTSRPAALAFARDD